MVRGSFLGGDRLSVCVGVVATGRCCSCWIYMVFWVVAGAVRRSILSGSGLGIGGGLAVGGIINFVHCCWLEVGFLLCHGCDVSALAPFGSLLGARWRG